MQEDSLELNSASERPTTVLKKAISMFSCPLWTRMQTPSAVAASHGQHIKTDLIDVNLKACKRGPVA